MSQKSKTTPKKRHVLSTPLLKFMRYKRGKVSRYLRNYGANVAEYTRFYIAPLSKQEIKSDSEEKAEKYIETTQAKAPNKKKKKLLNLLYFGLNIIVIGIVLWLQLSGETDPREQLSTIFGVNWWFILAALGTFALGMILDQVRYAVLIHKSTGAFRFNLSYKIGALGRYYDVITPLSTGGQPFQVLYLNRYGVKAGEGISVVMTKYILNQIVLFIGATFFLFRNLIVSANGGVSGFATGLASTFSWIGYSVLAVVIFVVTFISLNKRAGAGFVVGILKLLSKIRIGKFRLIKDYKKSFQSVMRTVNVWQKTTKNAIKSPLVLITNVVCAIGYFFTLYSMPFFIFCAFEGWHPEAWIQIITMSIMVDLSSAFNPIPMGTGTADLSFTAFFATFFATKGAQVWALLIWRFIFYYIYILQGFFVVSYDYVIGNRRLDKYKEFWKLPLRERAKVRREGRMKEFISDR